MQKKTNSLIFFPVVSMPISEVQYSRTFRKQPPKMQRLSHRLQEMLPIKNRTTGGLFQEDVQAHLCFVEDNLSHTISKLLHV